MGQKETCEEKLEVGNTVNMLKNVHWREKERGGTVFEINCTMGKREGDLFFPKETVEGSKEVIT